MSTHSIYPWTNKKKILAPSIAPDKVLFSAQKHMDTLEAPH